MNLSCPFCNHAFTSMPASPAICPRCGEALPRRGSAVAASTPIDLGAMVKRRVKGSLIAAAIIVAGIASVALWKVSQERKRNEVPAPPFVEPSASARPPLELRGLALLPANCNVVMAVQPGPLLVYAGNQKQDPVELLTKNRVPASALAALAKAGITLQMIDHIAVGILIPDTGEEFRIAIALVLRQKPADEKAFLDALKAKPAPGGFEVQFDRFPLKLKRVSDTDWVFGLTEKDLGGGSVSPGMKSILGERVQKDAAVWLALDRGEWTKKTLVAALLKGASWPPERIATLAKGQSATLSYSFDDKPRLRTAVRCADVDSAKALELYFELQASLPGSYAHATEDLTWVTLGKPVDPQDVLTFVKSMLDDAGR